MKKIFALGLLASIVSAPAMAASFTQDGITYDYSVKEADGATLISGTIVNSGKDFRLKVKGGKVSGFVGTSAVNFKTTSVVTTASVDRATVLAAK